MSSKKGILYLVSIGVGGDGYLSSDALSAISKSDTIIGYSRYVKELSHLFEDKRVLSSDMTKELLRANQAIDEALNGKVVSLLSSGDTNVYGISSFVFEILHNKKLLEQIEVISISGVSAFFALASQSGAIVGDDFVCINLSTKINEIKTIKKRVKIALEAEFIIGIYNPISRKKKEGYVALLDSLQEHKENLLVIIGSHLGLESQKVIFTDSDTLIKAGVKNPDIGMSTTLIIGNKNSIKISEDKILTPRVLRGKYGLDGIKKELHS